MILKGLNIKFLACLLIVIMTLQKSNAQHIKTYYIDCKRLNKEKLEKVKKDKYNSLIIKYYSDSTFPPDYLLKFENIESLTIYSQSTSISHFNVNQHNTATLKIATEQLQQLQKLTNIAFLGFSFPSFPNEFASYKTLRKLSINFSDMDSIPSSIQDFKNIEYLDLSTNRISYISPAIKELNQLKTLTLLNNKFKTLPDDLPHNLKCTVEFDNMYYGTTFITNYNKFDLSKKSELIRLKFLLKFCKIIIEVNSEKQKAEVKEFIGTENIENLDINVTP